MEYKHTWIVKPSTFAWVDLSIRSRLLMQCYRLSMLIIVGIIDVFNVSALRVKLTKQILGNIIRSLLKVSIYLWVHLSTIKIFCGMSFNRSSVLKILGAKDHARVKQTRGLPRSDSNSKTLCIFGIYGSLTSYTLNYKQSSIQNCPILLSEHNIHQLARK